MKNNILLEKYLPSWTEESKRIFSSPPEYIKNVFFYVQEVGYFKTKESYFTQRENLNSYLILYCISGMGELTYNNKKYTISKGQGFWIDCKTFHDYRNKNKSDWEFLWIHFYGDKVQGYYNQFLNNLSPVINFSENLTVAEMIQSIIYNEEHIDARTYLLNSYALTGIMTQFLLSIVGQYDNSFYMPKYLKNVKIDIERRFFESISLDELAARHCVDKYHLSREFKKWVGFSPIEYVISLRISHSKDLLKNSELTIREIAEHSGFNNVGHFINLFKRKENITPLQYRKMWR